MAEYESHKFSRLSKAEQKVMLDVIYELFENKATVNPKLEYGETMPLVESFFYFGEEKGVKRIGGFSDFSPLELDMMLCAKESSSNAKYN